MRIMPPGGGAENKTHFKQVSLMWCPRVSLRDKFLNGTDWSMAIKISVGQNLSTLFPIIIFVHCNIFSLKIVVLPSYNRCFEWERSLNIRQIVPPQRLLKYKINICIKSRTTTHFLAAVCRTWRRQPESLFPALRPHPSLTGFNLQKRKKKISKLNLLMSTSKHQNFIPREGVSN